MSKTHRLKGKVIRFGVKFDSLNLKKQRKLDDFPKYFNSKKEYEKIDALNSNQLAEGDTLIPMTILIDKYFRGDIVKLVDLSRISRILLICGN